MLKVLVLWVLLFTAPVWGQVAPPDVTVAQLNAAIERITTSLPEDDPQRAALLKSYAETRAALDSFAEFDEALKGFSRARANAAQAAALIDEKLTADVANPSLSVDREALLSTSLPELDQMLQVNKTELNALKGDLADIRAAIDTMPARSFEIRQRETELVDLEDDLEAQLGSIDRALEVGGQDEAELWLVHSQLASVNMEQAALNEELLSQPMRLDLLKAQLDQKAYKISKLEEKSSVMSERASELRRQEAIQASADAALVQAGTEGKHKLVQQLADENAELTGTFGERSEAIGNVRELEIKTSTRVEQLESDLERIEHKLTILGMSTALGTILREQQAQLPERRESIQMISTNEDNITASSLRQIELEDERRSLRDRTEYVESLVKGLDEEAAALVSADLEELLKIRRDLIGKAIELENAYSLALGDLDFSLRRNAAIVDRYRDFISERLLWIPSRDMLAVFSGAAFSNLGDQIQETFRPARWEAVLLAMPGELIAHPSIGLVILLALFLIYFGQRLKLQLVEAGKNVGYVRSDSFYITLEALVLSIVLSLKWPMLLLVVGWLFEMQESESELATSLFVPAERTALYFWGLEFLRIALLPKGLVDAHFRWPTKLVSKLSRRITTLECTLLPSVFLVGFFLRLYPREVGGPLGAVAVIFVLYSIAHFFHHLPPFVHSKLQQMFRSDKGTESSVVGNAIRSLLYWVPIVSIIAVIFGYTYTAIELSLLLIRTFVLLSTVLIFHELGLRWLRLTRLRMAFRVRQESVRNSNADGGASVEEDLLENDPELLNDEGTRLVNMLALIGGALGVVLIWAQVFPALGILNSVELWHQTGIVDGRELPVPVTLFDLLRALVIGIVAWVALGRIPNLVEILLRQKARMLPASAYALTRVFYYAAIIFLILFLVGSLGGSWSSMQWAVAALSLGIGFGLQEIVANFVSGLIILFEQPIRQGDVVTVGNVSGTVTKIQIRATTIRDFDNKELLVPNREFITNQLLNWSLSDAVTRRLVSVGVAYGTDLDEAMKIVDDVARRHPAVLADPMLNVTFDDFGDDSLLVTLRYYVGSLDGILTIDSELRLEIYRRFNEAGIVVAFPQRDIHLDTQQPLEIRMMGSALGKTDE